MAPHQDLEVREYRLEGFMSTGQVPSARCGLTFLSLPVIWSVIFFLFLPSSSLRSLRSVRSYYGVGSLFPPFFYFRTVMARRKKRQGLLSPLRVLDLTDRLGFMGGKILGYLGANVIKIEQTCRVLPRNHGPFDGIPE